MSDVVMNSNVNREIKCAHLSDHHNMVCCKRCGLT